MRFQLGLAALAVAAVAAAPASAAIDLSINSAAYTFTSFDTSTGDVIASNVVSLGGDGVSNDDIAFWTAETVFNLNGGVHTLTITDLASDDRTVVRLNGFDIGAAGIFGGGFGSFIFTPTGSAVPYTFLNNGSQSISVTGPFNTGPNTLQLIVNNTNAGIQGDFTRGPSSLFLTASVAGVPEPATWGLMLVGFGAMGAHLRSRRRAAA